MIPERGKAGDRLTAYPERRDAVRDHLIGVWDDLKNGAAQCLKRAALRLVDTPQVLVNFFGGHHYAVYEGCSAGTDYAVAVMRTPVEVTDELVDEMKEHFSDEQLVEITALLTVVNIDRFNAAFGIGSAGFSDGMVCVPPDRPAANPALTKIA